MRLLAELGAQVAYLRDGQAVLYSAKDGRKINPGGVSMWSDKLGNRYVDGKQAGGNVAFVLSPSFGQGKCTCEWIEIRILQTDVSLIRTQFPSEYGTGPSQGTNLPTNHLGFHLEWSNNILIMNTRFEVTVHVSGVREACGYGQAARLQYDVTNSPFGPDPRNYGGWASDEPNPPPGSGHDIRSMWQPGWFTPTADGMRWVDAPGFTTHQGLTQNNLPTTWNDWFAQLCVSSPGGGTPPSRQDECWTRQWLLHMQLNPGNTTPGSYNSAPHATPCPNDNGRPPGL